MKIVFSVHGHVMKYLLIKIKLTKNFEIRQDSTKSWVILSFRNIINVLSRIWKTKSTHKGTFPTARINSTLGIEHNISECDTKRSGLMVPVADKYKIQEAERGQTGVCAPYCFIANWLDVDRACLLHMPGY